MWFDWIVIILSLLLVSIRFAQSLFLLFQLSVVSSYFAVYFPASTAMVVLFCLNLLKASALMVTTAQRAAMSPLLAHGAPSLMEKEMMSLRIVWAAHQLSTVPPSLLKLDRQKTVMQGQYLLAVIYIVWSSKGYLPGSLDLHHKNITDP